MSERFVNLRVILLIGLLVCLAAAGCQGTAQPEAKTQASPHTAAALRALASYNKLETDIQSSLARAEGLAPSGGTVADLSAIVAGVRPKVSHQTGFIATATKELAAAKIPKPTGDYAKYLTLLSSAAAKKQRANTLAVRLAETTTQALEELPGDTPVTQIPEVTLVEIARQNAALMDLSVQARALEAQAATLRRQKKLTP